MIITERSVCGLAVSGVLQSPMVAFDAESSCMVLSTIWQLLIQLSNFTLLCLAGPACFQDNSINQGGDGNDTCEDLDIVNSERIDCHPEPGATREECLSRGCYWCQTSDSSPYCFMPKEHGYRMVGDPVETPSGYEVVLKRISYPTWYGLDIDDVLLEVDFQSDSRLRMKVRGLCGKI